MSKGNKINIVHIMGYLQLSDHVVQKSPYKRANDALGHVEQRNSNLVAFVWS